MEIRAPMRAGRGWNRVWPCRPRTASALETIRIGLPTKTYYPTIICETAQRQGLFAREGIERMPAREETMVGALAPA